MTVESESVETEPRRFPMNKPDGFSPAVQRYSARWPDTVSLIQMLYLGIQQEKPLGEAGELFLADAQRLFTLDDGPVHLDFARFTDPKGFETIFAVAYWHGNTEFERWSTSAEVSDWWADPAKENGEQGYFWEAMQSSVHHTETIAFKEYIRGLSACPMSRIEPMGESGYWGAARDRIPASARDALATEHAEPLAPKPVENARGSRVRVKPPSNIAVIRSGVSWVDCGEEQLNSYNANIRPKLDIGMEFLRSNPVETGCCFLRQVDVIEGDGSDTREAYSVGVFLSLEHLEVWAKEHPTHLAIYNRAQMERKKYQEKLELRTYHEVYVVDSDTSFEYVNCHGETGLLPYFRT